MGDFRYFEINASPSESLQTDYQEKEKSYLETVQLFRADQLLHPPRNRSAAVEWVDELGGDCYAGNWTSFGLPVEYSRNGDVSSALPLTHDARRFRYVGCLKGYRYRKNCADGLLLFYDPKDAVALMTFDWT